MSTPDATLDARFSDPAATAAGWDETAGAGGRPAVLDMQVRADGRPHLTPLVAVRLDGALYSSTGAGEQKAVNLRGNPYVLLLTGSHRWDDGLDVVAEGDAVQVTDEALLTRLAREWAGKWDGQWDFEVRDGTPTPSSWSGWRVRTARTSARCHRGRCCSRTTSSRRTVPEHLDIFVESMLSTRTGEWSYRVARAGGRLAGLRARRPRRPQHDGPHPRLQDRRPVRVDPPRPVLWVATAPTTSSSPTPPMYRPRLPGWLRRDPRLARWTTTWPPQPMVAQDQGRAERPARGHSSRLHEAVIEDAGRGPTA